MSRLRDKVTAISQGSLSKISPARASRAAAKLAARAVSKSHPSVALAEALAQVAIESIKVRGAQGVFEGSASDRAVIQRYAVERAWSPKTLSRVLDFFRQSKGTYIDVGANIGLTAIPVAAAGIRTLAFEPVPQNFSYLKRNVALNDVGQFLEPFNLAAIDQPGEITFELSPTNHGDHRYRRGEAVSRMGENEWATVNVEGKRLDYFIDRVEQPLVVKIDTQGSEPLVISGGRKLLDCASLVICEFSPYAMTRMNTSAQVIADYFATFDSVEIYEGESEDVRWVLSGDALRSFLCNYYDQYRSTPTRRYLNLIGKREIVTSVYEHMDVT